MSARTVLSAIAIGRLLFGLWMLVSPRHVAGRWVGEDAANDAGGVLARAVGGRDIAFALGSLAAVRSERDPLPWLAAGVLVDGTDAASALAATEVPLVQRAAAIAVAGGTVGLSLFGLGLTEQD